MTEDEKKSAGLSPMQFVHCESMLDPYQWIYETNKLQKKVHGKWFCLKIKH